MPTLAIDGRLVTVAAGQTVLDAARQLGVDIPALCQLPGCTPNTACMACVVRLRGTEKYLPACATPATDGLDIESESPAVAAVRRTVLDLLLSDHEGECRAPCQYACPFGSDTPRMLRALAARDLDTAIVTLRSAVPLAGALTRLGPDTCSGSCRRRSVDEPIAIGRLRQHVADQPVSPQMLAALSQRIAAPGQSTPTARRVTIVGAGPAGLAAAELLARAGHAVSVIEPDKPGGSLIGAVPPAVLARELDLLGQLGVRLRRGPALTADALPVLQRESDAVVLATGGSVLGHVELAGGGPLDEVAPGVRVARGAPLVFAGETVRPRGPVQAAVAGRAAAQVVAAILAGRPPAAPPKLSNLHIHRPGLEVLQVRAAQTPGLPPPLKDALRAPEATLTPGEAAATARQRLHCDCERLESCKLHQYASRYGADGARYRGARRQHPTLATHPEVVLEPGKCILCGLCIQAARDAGAPFGLTFLGRGFDTRVAAPFDMPLSTALGHAASACVAVCPTGALRHRSL